MKLNKRLLALSEMVTEPYQLVWDCCCDHGLLGFKILADGVVKQVNFVDVVPEIISQLEDKLTTYAHHLPVGSCWKTLCQDVALLPLLHSELTTEAKPTQLVIISGIGGELMIEILTRLMHRYAGLNIDFLLCPVHHTYKLRSALVKLNFKLKKEQLVIENKRGYELILVNQVADKKVSLTGQGLWLPQINHQQYLSKLITHYQRIASATNKSDLLNQSALIDYQNLFKKNYENL